MEYRPLSRIGDYTINQKFLTGDNAILQAVETRLKLLLEEWWENRDNGLPFFQEIAGYSDNEMVSLIITERILETDGVKEVTNVNHTLKNRKYTYTCDITTDNDNTLYFEQDMLKGGA